MSAPRFFMVSSGDEMGVTHFGYFTDEATATAYCAELNGMREQYDNEAFVSEHELDRDRSELRGGWYVVLSPDGKEWSAVASQIFTPGDPPRWVGEGYDNAFRDWGELRQGFGLTREAAARAAATLPPRRTPSDDAR